VQALNATKLELSQYMAEQQQLERDRKERQAQLASFATELKTASAEHAAAGRLVRRLTLEQQDTDQPRILDYIRLKHDNMVRSHRRFF
jgi:hypothetical protein